MSTGLTHHPIIEQHKGSIGFSSEAGKGTRFRITLPSAPGRERESKLSENAQSLTGKGETILVAEDDAQVRQMDIHLLENAGYRVLAANDGDKAVHIFMLNADRIDLALLDMVMPEKNGRAVFEVIHKHSRGLPVIFTTGYSFDMPLSELVPEENAKLIPKPHTSEELLGTVRKMLDRWKR